MLCPLNLIILLFTLCVLSYATNHSGDVGTLLSDEIFRLKIEIAELRFDQRKVTEEIARMCETMQQFGFELKSLRSLHDEMVSEREHAQKLEALLHKTRNTTSIIADQMANQLQEQ